MGKYLDNMHLAAVDTETTGLDPNYNEIVELAVIPLSVTFKPIRMPFHAIVKPNFPERLYADATGEKREEIKQACKNGFERAKVIDMFDAWFDMVMQEHGTVKFMALGQNYAFDAAFLKAFFTVPLYERYFHYHYRDSMIMAHCWNDVAIMRGQPIPFPKSRLKNLADQLGVPLDRAHTAVADAAASAGVYAKLVEYGANLIL